MHTRFNLAISLCMSQSTTLITNTKYLGFFCFFQWLEMIDYCSFIIIKHDNHMHSTTSKIILPSPSVYRNCNIKNTLEEFKGLQNKQTNKHTKQKTNNQKQNKIRKQSKQNKISPACTHTI